MDTTKNVKLILGNILRSFSNKKDKEKYEYKRTWQNWKLKRKSFKNIKILILNNENNVGNQLKKEYNI